MRWFGESWLAPVNEDTEHAPTPVGQLCGFCEQPIRADDQGFLIPHLAARDALMCSHDSAESENREAAAYHAGCLADLILGPEWRGLPKEIRTASVEMFGGYVRDAGGAVVPGESGGGQAGRA